MRLCSTSAATHAGYAPTGSVARLTTTDRCPRKEPGLAQQDRDTARGRNLLGRRRHPANLPLQGLPDVLHEIVGMLDAHGEAHEVRGAKRSGSLDARAMLRQALHRTEGRRALEHA